MITSQQSSLLFELRQKPIPAATLVELEARLQHRIHSMALDAFNKSGLSQKELADRLGWDTARVSRCLGTSSNWTLKTISALLGGIGVDLDDPSYTSFDELERRLKAHATLSHATALLKKKPSRETLDTIRLQIASAASRCSGATTSFIVALSVGADSDLAKRIQPKTQGETIPYLDYPQTVSGQSEHALPNIGVANAG